MDEVWIDSVVSDDYITNAPVLGNRIGYYSSPQDDVVKRTLDDFFCGSPNLLFHVYYYLDSEIDWVGNTDNRRWPM